MNNIKQKKNRVPHRPIMHNATTRAGEHTANPEDLSSATKQPSQQTPPKINLSQLPTNHTPIPYPNRPILSLLLALFFFLLGLIPGVPAWLGIGAAIGFILDDLLSWFPLNILNAPRAFLLKRKRIKTTLRILGGLAAMAGMYWANQTIWNISNHPLLAIILKLRTDMLMGVFSYAVAILIGIIVVKLVCCCFNLDISTFNQIVIGMGLGAVVAMWCLPSALMLNSLTLDVSFFSILTAGFVGALTMKVLCKLFYWMFLGHSNADG